jgi:hypothetical protein
MSKNFDNYSENQPKIILPEITHKKRDAILLSLMWVSGNPLRVMNETTVHYF